MTRLGPRFHRLWGASTGSNLADGLLLVGVPLVAVELTRNPLAISGLQVAATLPWLLLALPVGVLADRRDRRRLIIAANVGRATLIGLLGLVLLSGTASMGLLYLVVLSFGIGEVVSDTTAQSLLPDLVDAEQLSTANGRLIGAQTVMNNFVGAPLAGVLVSVSAASVVLGPAALYLLAAVLLVPMAGSYRPPRRAEATVRTDIAEGIRTLWERPVLRALAALGSMLNLSSAAYFSVFVLFAVGEESPMGLEQWAYGLLAALLAAGAVAGSLVAGWLTARIGPRRVLIGSVTTFGFAMAIPVVTAEVVPVGVMAVALGAASTLCNVTVVSARQTIVPREVLGRVNSAFRLLVIGSAPIGAALGGVIAGSVGLRPLFAVAAAMQLVALALCQGPIRDAALRAAPAPTPTGDLTHTG
ncbi:MAG: MFS transporter [Nitriliruptoraceae bacterium]|nr:MFS transporter [Nitriliruptoraceae bacterium]